MNFEKWVSRSVRWGGVVLLGQAMLGASVSLAAPVCLGSNGQSLPVDDAQVLVWKATTANQTLERAHVAGPVTQIYPDETGHQHFEIQIGSGSDDTLEVVYNISFGEIPIQIGDQVEACGDYITSDAATSQYPASPDNAIIHWVHRNPSGHGHPDGFTVVNGVLYGQGNGDGG